MENKYPVEFRGENIGVAFVRSLGLYYHITCQCDKPDDSVYKLIAMGESSTAEVGICIPENNSFVFAGRLPQTKFPKDIIHFALRIHRHLNTESVVRLLSNKEFPYISKLTYGKLCRSEEGIGVIFSESI